VCRFGFFFRGKQIALGLPVFGEIAKDQNNAAHGAISVANGCTAVVDRDFASVTADEQGVVSQSDDNPLLHHFLDRIFGGLSSLLAQDSKNLSGRASSRFGKGPTGDAFRHWIHEIDAPLLVRHYDAVTNAAVSDAEE